MRVSSCSFVLVNRLSISAKCWNITHVLRKEALGSQYCECVSCPVEFVRSYNDVGWS